MQCVKTHCISACQKSPHGLFARFKNAMFFVKLHFTKNLAVLVKKPDKSDFFNGFLSNSRRAAAPSSSPCPSLLSKHSFLVL